MIVSILSAVLIYKQYACLCAGQGAVYTYDPVGNFERVGYSCQASFKCLIALTHLGVCAAHLPDYCRLVTPLDCSVTNSIVPAGLTPLLCA